MAHRALRLGGVLDHRHDRRENGLEGLHRCRLSEEVDRDHGAGPGRQRRLDAGRVDEQELVVDVDEDGGCAGADHGLGGGEEGVGRDDDLVARPHADRPQRELEGVGAVGDADAVSTPANSRVGLLEGLDVGAADEAPVGRTRVTSGITSSWISVCWAAMSTSGTG